MCVGIDRRLASRYGVADAPVDWKEGAGISARRRAWIRDISATGVRMVVPASEHVVVGNPVDVSLDASKRFTALVRWKRVMDGWMHCGLEYIDTTDAYRLWRVGVIEDPEHPPREAVAGT